MTASATDSRRNTPARLASSAILACQSDERLVKLVRSGHERAFDAIVERYRTQLVRYCGRILPESRCEDAVQQSFINAHAALSASDDLIQLKPWLFAITRNAALNMLRQNGWNYEQIPLDFDGVRRPDQVFEERIELQQTVEAIDDLPARQRDALVMREFEGRSYDEIASVLGANDGAVRQLLNRARVTLRTAASALIPPPLVARAASLPQADGRRMAELLGGLGAAGAAKAGATAIVAGSLVVGAVKAPLPIGESHKPTREKATLTPRKAPTAAASAAHETPVALRTSPPASHAPTSHSAAKAPAVHHGSSHSGSSHSGTSHSGLRQGSSERDGSGETHHSGGGTRERSGSDDDRTHSRTQADDSPKSGSDDHSDTSSDDGSDDHVATLTEPDDSSDSTDSGSSDSTDSPDSSSDSSSSGTSGTDTSGTSGTSDPLDH